MKEMASIEIAYGQQHAHQTFRDGCRGPEISDINPGVADFQRRYCITLPTSLISRRMEALEAGMEKISPYVRRAGSNNSNLKGPGLRSGCLLDMMRNTTIWCDA